MADGRITRQMRQKNRQDLLMRILEQTIILLDKILRRDGLSADMHIIFGLRKSVANLLLALHSALAIWPSSLK